MALAYQAISAIATAAAGTTSITLTEPAGTQMGDKLVAVIAYRSNVAWTVPTGWTKRAEENTGDTQTTSAAIASILVADIDRGPTAPSLVFTRAAGELARAYIVALRPTAGNYAVYETSSSNTLAAAAVGLTVPSITTGGAGRVIVAGMAGVRGNGSANWSAQACTDPAAMTERADVSVSTSPTLSISVSAASQSASGATGTFNATCVFSGRHAGALLSYYETPYTGATIIKTDEDVGASSTTSFTFTAKSFGGATTSDYTVLALGSRSTSSVTVTSVVIDGVTATLLIDQLTNNGGQFANSNLWIIPATGNATGNVVITFSGNGRPGITVYRLRGASSTPVDTEVTSTHPQNVSLTVPANGCAVATGEMGAGASSTAAWVGLLEDSDIAYASAHGYSAASAQFLTAQSPASITCTFSPSSATNSFVSASFGPPSIPAVTGTIAQTTTIAAQAASGSVTAAPAVTGTIAQTTTIAAQAASGTVTAAPAVSGTIAQTTAAASQAASGTVAAPGAISGTIAQTTTIAAQAASGTVTAAPAVSGTIAQTLMHAIQAASGTSQDQIAGTIAQTITRAAQAASGTVTAAPAVSGTIVQTLSPATQAASGAVTAAGAIGGTIAQTLSPAQQSASGTVTAAAAVSGTIVQTITHASQAATGLVAAAGTITGTIAQTISPAFQAAVGTVTGGITPEPPGRVGGGFANWSSRLDRKRQERWQEQERARQELRTSLRKLVKGEPEEQAEARTEAREAVAALGHARRDLSMPELREFRGALQHLERDVLRALIGAKLNEVKYLQLQAQMAAVEAAAEAALDAARQEEEAIVALLA